MRLFPPFICESRRPRRGSDGGLSAACKDLYPEDPHYCFMSPHMHPTIDTPFYVFNSKYDSWQL